MIISSPDLLAFVVDHLDVGIFAVDREYKLVLWNRFMAAHSNCQPDQVIGRNLFECFPELPRKWLERKLQTVFVVGNYSFTSWEQRPCLFRFPHSRPITGSLEHMHQNCTLVPVKNAEGQSELVCVTLFDYTDVAVYQGKLRRAMDALEAEREEQQRLIAKLENAHNQLLQSEKLASIGQLAAGVAHEINNPIGFVNSNLGSLEKYAKDLLTLVAKYELVEGGIAQKDMLNDLHGLKDQLDIEYLKEDLPTLIRESRDGLERVKKIVQDLKDFSRVGESEWIWADIHKALDSTLNVVWNELKYKAKVVREYGDLPEIECAPSQLNQVFLNLLVNAGHAIAETGTITVRTRREDDWVAISVTDTGCGIAPEHLSKIFDPFFTTKPVGAGTGLGLSVSHSIIRKHNGRIEVDSKPGEGACFTVWLPIRQKEMQALA